MNTTVSSLMWGFGLTPEDGIDIRTGAGPSYRLEIFSARDLPDIRDSGAANPFLIWIPLHLWTSMDNARREEILAASFAQKIILLDSEPTAAQLEHLLDLGIMSVLSRPLKPGSITRAVEKAAETQRLFSDIYCMAKEVSLERELLSRKNAQLSFINRFITRASESLEPASILLAARQDLDMLLPVHMIHAAFWDARAETLDADLFLESQDDPKAEQDWTEFMLESAARLAERPVDGYRITHLRDVGPRCEPLSPAPGQVMLLPLSGGGQTFGSVALHSLRPYNLGRDQVEILKTAVRHLSLALRNGLLYREMKTRADFDGLTRIYNRSYFDTRLKEEIRRHYRYGQKMSLLLLDLDHFKRINDTHGHPCGDAVLRAMGLLLQQTIRITDFAARYGGEEFAIILPQTDEHQALVLAERLREAVSQLPLPHDNLSITTSIGVATTDPDSSLSPVALLQQADQAMYLAKSGGRNQVRSLHDSAGATCAAS